MKYIGIIIATLVLMLASSALAEARSYLTIKRARATISKEYPATIGSCKRISPVQVNCHLSEVFEASLPALRHRFSGPEGYVTLEWTEAAVLSHGRVHLASSLSGELTYEPT